MNFNFLSLWTWLITFVKMTQFDLRSTNYNMKSLLCISLFLFFGLYSLMARAFLRSNLLTMPSKGSIACSANRLKFLASLSLLRQQHLILRYFMRLIFWLNIWIMTTMVNPTIDWLSNLFTGVTANSSLFSQLLISFCRRLRLSSGRTESASVCNH